MTRSRLGRRPVPTTSTVMAAAAALVGVLLVPVPAAAAVCTANAVVCENQLPGTPQSEWDIEGAGDDTIQGFSTDISVNVGSRVDFKIKTDATGYVVDVYRLGWYGGTGARKVATVQPSAFLPQVQPECVSDPATSLYDCGTWAVSASWGVPSSAASGVYIAKLERADTGGSSHIPFIVRDDSRRSDVVFQTSDTTWQAYNTYGGSNFYYGTNGRALKLSYNRPFATRAGTEKRDFLFANEYPLIRFMERNGYDVSYISGLDTDRAGAQLLNHDVFLSVGHDEYWSGDQRANVEAARDAGVNMAFLSGNEMYWKTRWEPSIDGAQTADRTLVCYKETWDNAKTDPAAEWTGTWRDPRFSPPSDGGRPENAVSGTAYMSNYTDLAIQVSAAEGRARLWRHTPAAQLADGASLALAPHTIGYESNEDLENGHRPDGAIRLSTTTGPTPEYLRDFGNVVTPGTTTHHLVMYRAPSGALVFGAGTVQWTWGLDENHDGDGAPADPVIQQAMINLLADMDAQPGSLMAGMTRAAASVDTVAPVVTVTSPSAGAQVPNGTTSTVTGTASDVGGVVAGVEVSTDGGATWRVADGTSSWSYSYTQQGLGVASIRVRATDDSVNTGPAAQVGVVASCPCTLFGPEVPATPDAGDGGAVELGVKVTPDVDGWVTGVRFYKSAANVGSHTGSLWTASGELIATGTFIDETPTGWQTLTFAAPVAVAAGTTYVASYHAPNGRYAADKWAFSASGRDAPPLSSPRSAGTAENGVYRLGSGFPVESFGASNYWVDVVFDDKDTHPPAVVDRSPLPGASSVDVATKPTATLSEPLDAASVEVSLLDAQGRAVVGTAGYDASTSRVTFSPLDPLAHGATYRVSVRAADVAGNRMTAADTWTFRTTSLPPPPGVCPCSIWDDTAVPAQVTVDDAGTVELGVSFTADGDGIVQGVRFYKGPRNTGPHTGTLWSSEGAALATASFSSESTTGWQTVSFAQPVPVTAGTTYVASYQTTSGFYSVTSDGLADQGVDNPPLHALAGGAVYRYGGGFPTSTSRANYWVDVVYSVPATVLPTVARSAPADGSTNVPVGDPVDAVLSMPIQPGSAALALSGPGGAVAGTTGYDSRTRTVRFTPSTALREAAVYTVTVSGARNLGGGQMAGPVTFSFTTAGVEACPCTLFSSSATPSVVDSGEGAALTLGVKVVPSSDGYMTGVRFYKNGNNVGTHTGSVWSAAGERLESVTFTNESAAGWQTATFAQAVPVVAGTAYIVTYYAPNGRYAVDSTFFEQAWTNGPLTAPGGSNGVYGYGGDVFPNGTYNSANYWVDVVFMPGTAPDTTPPAVIGIAPLDASSSVHRDEVVTARFSETIDASSVQMTLEGPGGAPVAGLVRADAASVTFTPSSELAENTDYTARVRVSDESGNGMAGPASWSFRTVLPPRSAGTCPCSIWDDTDAPASLHVAEPDGVEIGVSFRADVPGDVTGVRFYKGPSNAGPHAGSLWDAQGVRIATATFGDESSTGWQTVTFDAPVPIVPGVTYIASYRAPNGFYSVTGGGLATPVLRAPLGTVERGGAYTYGTGAPTSTSTSNYWVDVVFRPTA